MAISIYEEVQSRLNQFLINDSKMLVLLAYWVHFVFDRELAEVELKAEERLTGVIIEEVQALVMHIIFRVVQREVYLGLLVLMDKSIELLQMQFLGEVRTVQRNLSN
jgi:hypothetical protein